MTLVSLSHSHISPKGSTLFASVWRFLWHCLGIVFQGSEVKISNRRPKLFREVILLLLSLLIIKNTSVVKFKRDCVDCGGRLHWVNPGTRPWSRSATVKVDSSPKTRPGTPKAARMSDIRTAYDSASSYRQHLVCDAWTARMSCRVTR